MSELLIHEQVTLHGSGAHRDRYSLDQAEEAYRVADRGTAGKVCIVFP